MLHRFFILFKLVVFWILFFFTARALFMVYNHSLSASATTADLILSIAYGLHMDLSVVGYLLVLYNIIFAALFFVNNHKLLNIFKAINYPLIAIAAFIVVADSELYRNWGFRMDTTPLLYLKTPGEAAASLKWWMIAVLIVAAVLYAYATIRFYKKIISTSAPEKKCSWYSIPVFIFLMAASIIPIRGGTGISTMQPGTVYFSRNFFPNHAAVNVIWNLGYSFTKLHNSNCVNYMKPEQAAGIYQNLFPQQNKPFAMLKTDKPDIILIISESFSAAIVDKSISGKEITPGFNELKKNGIYFSQFYASGDRTERGLVAIISGYPSQIHNPIIGYPSKTEKLPSISNKLKKAGYSTALYYGGDIEFANMKSYFMQAGFDSFTTKHNFSQSDLNSKWGAHDHVVFNKLFSDIANSKGPFFKVFFTLSCHEPFEIQGKNLFEGNSEEIRYLNAAHYADSSLYNFVTRCSRLPIWENLLIIIVADHGSRFPGDIPVHVPEKFHIPMLWTGGAVLKPGSIISSIGSQNDIANTLLKQMNLNDKDFIFGKNMFSEPLKPFALYCFNNGIGFIREKGIMVWDNNSGKHLIYEGDYADSATIEGKGLYQYMIDDYLKK